MNRRYLEQLARDWRRQMVLRDFLCALAAAGFVLAFTLAVAGSWRWQAPLLGLFGAWGVLLVGNRPWKLDAAQVARHLDRACPELEESASLFLRSPDSLTLLEKLQLDRVNRSRAERSGEAWLPGRPPAGYLHRATGTLAAGILAVVIAGGLPPRPVSSFAPAEAGVPRTQPPPSARLPPKIIGNTFTVTPPAYTGHASRTANGFTVEAEEGSTVAWRIDVGQMPRDAKLSAGAIDVPLQEADGRLAGLRSVRDSMLFVLSGTLPDGSAWNPSELFSIKVLKDQPPTVRIVQPAQTRTEIVPPVTGPVIVQAAVTDDYAVTDAHLVATVAKGSGESVKFREQTIPFDAGGSTKVLDLAALGMEPGDELYFFVEAFDNRQPTANRTRSETRFVRLRGPDERQTTTGRGIAGINLVPQYFRSERQLIIDTEKLLADQPALPDREFRTRGNDLGADQALLRLRYGRFLAEDQEDSPLTDHLETTLDPLQRPAPAAAPGPHAAAGIAQRFRQEHLEQDREGGGADAGANFPPGGTPLSAEQVRQPFVDSHDQHDKNTFFDTETKGTMRDALSAMWAAEGLLRTARPGEALAPEHRALDILKDLQQSTRAYVQHVGFEAPPLKIEARRLQGETTDVPPRLTTQNTLPPLDPAVANIRAFLTGFAGTGTIAKARLDAIQAPLAAAATRQPEEFLAGLQALRQRQAGQALTADALSTLQRALLRLLPPANPLPARRDEPAPALAARYSENLQTGGASP